MSALDFNLWFNLRLARTFVSASTVRSLVSSNCVVRQRESAPMVTLYAAIIKNGLFCMLGYGTGNPTLTIHVENQCHFLYAQSNAHVSHNHYQYSS